MNDAKLTLTLCLGAFLVASAASTAPAQARTPVPQYSLPWGLRPAIASTLVRSDTGLGYYDGGSTVASTFAAGYAIVPKEFGVYARGAYVHSSPDAGESGGGFGNPLVFGLYTPKLSKNLRLAAFGGVALPLGQGGGNEPDLATKAAVSSAVPTRSSMDNALFAVNDLVPTGGLGLAYVDSGLTVQIEATVLQLIRAKGDRAQKDSSKTNFTSGVHAGYFLTDMFSLGAELRYQRWLSTPSFVKDELGNRDQLTFAAGPRANFALAEGVLMRPGVAFAMPLDDPMKKAEYKVIQLDIPVTF